MEKIILTDVDNVLLSWEDAFHEYVTKKGINQHSTAKYNIEEKYGIHVEHANELIADFSNSDFFANIRPHRSAEKYIPKLMKLGYRFHCISAVPDTKIIRANREKNLHKIFGENFFDRLVLTKTSNNKVGVLKEYSGSNWWIEDLTSAANFGIELGHKSVLINHHYNAADETMAIRVDDWAEIFELISSN